MDAVLTDLRNDLETLSSDSHATLVDAPHEIPTEEPGSVIEAIEAVLGRIAA